ncbi:MAG: slipin family protein [Bryobacteraceae bacterium]
MPITVLPGFPQKPSSNQLAMSPLGAAAFGAVLLVGMALTASLKTPVFFVASVPCAILCLFGLRQVDQWDKAIVLRLGKFRGLRGPGLFTIIPVIDSVSRVVDQRIRVTGVTAEAALTRDTVPVSVDAIVYWVVWDAEKAVLEVENFTDAITFGAQTALREAIGAHELGDLIARRDEVGKELQKILDEKTNPWGVTVQSVEIKQVIIPQALEDAMSRKAQAERERQARILLSTAEAEISQKFAEASALYQNNPVALNLRAMNLLYEAMKERGSMVVIPSQAVQSLGVGNVLGLASMGGASAGPGAEGQAGK